MFRVSRSSEENFHFLSSQINLDSTSLKQALSALVLHLESNILTLDQGQIIISSIKAMKRKSFMRIDEEVLK